MNLKNRIRIAIFLILILPAGCVNRRIIKNPTKDFNPDKEFTRTLWSEAIKITQASSDTPLPNIFFESREEKSVFKSEDCFKYQEDKDFIQCEKDNENLAKAESNLGRAFLQDYKIRIFCDTILDDLYGNSGLIQPGTDIQLVYILSVVAHEFLHQLYWKMGVPTYDQHKKMKESGDLAKLMDYISDKYGVKRNNICRKYSMNSLDFGIELDEIYKRQSEREKLRPF